MNQHQLFFPLGLRRLSVLLLVLSAAKQRFGRRPSELYAQAFQSVASSYNHRAEKLQRSFILKRSSLPRSSSLSLPSPSQSYASRSGVSGGADAVSDEDEWYPHDPAWTTPQLLEGIWSQIAQAKDMVRGEINTVIYPQMQDELVKPRYLNLLFAHLDACKDVCDHFGISTSLVPYQPKGSTKVTGFTVKSFRKAQPNKSTMPTGTSTATTGTGTSTTTGENGEFDFAYDPFWDDGTDFEALYDGIDDEHMVPDRYPAIENKVPDSDDQIIDVSKQWVAAMMSDMGVCPFTQGADKAGLPMGDVFYAVDRSSGFEDMYARYWKEVVRVEQNTEKDISTTLLITPEFCMDNLELFESFTNTLTQPLTALGIEDLIQLVFFHPVWSFRDGSARTSAEGQAANYARRSPWPMINILRTTQVRAAQKGIPTGLVYKQNEKTLSNIGVDKLETMLRLRDWTDTAEHKVNRKEVDALKIAQDFQTVGKVSETDLSLQHDATPAANKVDRRQVEEGNLVNVLLQALEKRLGKADPTNPVLSGPETSATAMATDVLIDELERIMASKQSTMPSVSPATPSSLHSGNGGSTESLPQEIAMARQARIDAARRMMLEDVANSGESSEASSRSSAGPRRDLMPDVMFGRAGIGERNLEDEMFPEGMNPDSFY